MLASAPLLDHAGKLAACVESGLACVADQCCEGTPFFDHAGCCRFRLLLLPSASAALLQAHCADHPWLHTLLTPCARACLPSAQAVQELYRTLQYCGVHWKKNGPYNLKCRAVLHLSPSAAGEAGGVAAANGQAGLGRDPSDDSMGVAMEASPAAGAQQQQGGLAAALAAEDARMVEAAAAVVGSGSGAGERPRVGRGNWMLCVCLRWLPLGGQHTRVEHCSRLPSH